MCGFSTGATSRMATSQFAVWVAAFGLFLMLQTCWTQQGYAFYAIIFSYGVDTACFGYAECVIDKSVNCSPTQVACHCNIGRVPEVGGEGVAGTESTNSRNMIELLMVLFFCCSTRYRTGYVARYRTMYSSLFACCSGYIRSSTRCLRKPCSFSCELLLKPNHFGFSYIYHCITPPTPARIALNSEYQCPAQWVT